jgi:CheY-like chemotaxis protein
MRKILKDAGFQVVTALNVLDMGAKLKVGELPKIIFLDVMMPEIDGWKAAELLKR